MTKKNEKKKRLIASALHLFREKGYHATTLATIAQDASVPLGNVYYYFKSKEELLVSVLNYILQEIQKITEECNQQSHQKERLKHFIRKIIEQADDFSKYGDPLIAFSKEIEDDSLLMKLHEATKSRLKWIHQQFFGLSSDPQRQAHYFLQRLQGIIAVGMGLNEPTYITEHCENFIREFG